MRTESGEGSACSSGGQDRLDNEMRIILPLIVLQAVSIAVMASLGSGPAGQGIFSVLLATDLISFAVHVNRVERAGASPSRYFLLGCLLAVVVLLFAILTLT